MPFHPNQQNRLVSEYFDPAQLIAQSLAQPAPWDTVIDFMTHPSFVGRRLYPRQRTLYKLIFLETENFTDYDREVIAEWQQGFLQRRDTFGVQPDIMERVAYLKKHGYRRFPHIQLVLGRRGSKGIIGGGLGAEQMAYLYSLDDWQAYYDIDPGQNSVVSVVATSQTQAQKYQFADIRRTVLRCKYLAPHVATSKDYFLSIRTPADIRRIAQLKAAKTKIDHEIATITGEALSASSSAGRGGAGSANFFDEMAHMVMGTGSVKSGDEIYNAYKPSLDQFGKDKLIVANSSPFTKIGIFYKLYQDGCVPMQDYRGQWHMATERSLGIDAEEQIKIHTAEPEMLILQLPSWGLYQDWEKGPKLIGVKFKRPITYSPVGSEPENMSMAREEGRNPSKFKVERRGQFAEVEGAYLDPIAVDAMFRDPAWRPPLMAQSRGYLTHKYRAHVDPSRTGANTALAVGHTEIAPCDTCGMMPTPGQLTFHPCTNCTEAKRYGMHWPHVIFDLLKVWRPGDSDPDEEGRRKINPIEIQASLRDVLYRFPSMTKLTFDQYDSALGIAQLSSEFSPGIRIAEVIFAEKENQRRSEKLKDALNLGWMHAYNDGFYEDGGSLLEVEMKFLAERNGRVVKQDFGPVTTKDLFDAVSVVATDLLKDALERHHSASLVHPSFGATEVAGLKNGREFTRVGGPSRQVAERLSGMAENPAREKLGGLHNNHPRRDYQPTRAESIRARGMPRAGGGRRRGR